MLRNWKLKHWILFMYIDTSLFIIATLPSFAYEVSDGKYGVYINTYWNMLISFVCIILSGTWTLFIAKNKTN